QAIVSPSDRISQGILRVRRVRLMQRFKESLRRHALMSGLIAVAIPLVAHLSLQYQSLSELQSTTPIARRAIMRHYLSETINKVISHYKQMADETLDIPNTAFRHVYPDPSPDFDIDKTMDAEQIAAHFYSHPFKGARLFFTGILSGETAPTTATVKFYD